MPIDTKGSSDIYRYYRLNSDNPVGIYLFRKISGDFVKFIMKKIFSGFDIQLSHGKSLGILTVRGKKPKITIDKETGDIKGASPDWGNSRKLWKQEADKLGITLKQYIEQTKDKTVLVHLNEHSNGIRYSINWLRFGMISSNKKHYTFVPSRANKRTIPKKVRQGADYFVYNE